MSSHAGQVHNPVPAPFILAAAGAAAGPRPAHDGRVPSPIRRC
ncbi:hypothetical protein [Rothia endophytica]